MVNGRSSDNRVTSQASVSAHYELEPHLFGHAAHVFREHALESLMDAAGLRSNPRSCDTTSRADDFYPFHTAILIGGNAWHVAGLL